MTTTTKAANYSDADLLVMRETYTGVDNKAEVAEIATALGKTVPSVRAKLSNLGLYKVADKPKTGAKGSTKTVIAEAIAKEAGLSEAEVEGLTKSTKGALEKVLARLTNG
jgi:hypothetical protein